MRFHALDGWRGIGALLVAAYHFEVQSHFYEGPIYDNIIIVVDLFFVLSGFVISYAYLDKLRSPGGVRTFIITRIGRVWPLHVFVLSAFVIIESAKTTVFGSFGVLPDTAAFGADENMFSLLTNLLLVHSLGIHDSLTWNFPSWSVSTEFYTYITFALVAIVCVRRLVVFSAILVIGGLWVLWTYSNNFMDVTYDYGYFRCLAGFFAGHIVYFLFKTQNLTGRLSPAWFNVLEVIGVALLLGSFIILSEWTALLSPLVYAAAVYIFAHNQGAVSRFLAATPFKMLGAWSYSIYMVHALVLLGIKGFGTLADKAFGTSFYAEPMLDLGSQVAGDFATIVYLIVVVACATLTYRFIELPGIAMFKELAARRLKSVPT